MENCLESNYTKPGYCPDKASMTPFEAVCLIACVDDSRCPDLTKCCRHDCGVTCMHPIGLNNVTGMHWILLLVIVTVDTTIFYFYISLFICLQIY